MQPAGVPFVVSLVRFERMGYNGRFQLAPLVNNSQAQRNARMQRACDKKFPKLATWKRSDNALTILVLEDNDRQLSNASIIAETFLPIALARTDRPDETYGVDTCSNTTWYAWPILIGTQTFFDLSELHPIHFKMDATGQLIGDVAVRA
jgi:hypothetical protein